MRTALEGWLSSLTLSAVVLDLALVLAGLVLVAAVFVGAVLLARLVTSGASWKALWSGDLPRVRKLVASVLGLRAELELTDRVGQLAINDDAETAALREQVRTLRGKHDQLAEAVAALVKKLEEGLNEQRGSTGKGAE